MKNAGVNRINSVKARRIVSLLLAFALIFSMGRDFGLHGVFAGNTSETVLTCGLSEHTHGMDCYKKICGQEEVPPHIHGDGCYESRIICGLETEVGHIHDESCYENVLICAIPEGEGHLHTYDCLERETVCGLTEADGHFHTDDCYVYTDFCESLGEGHTHLPECYKYVALCGLEEHTHSEQCYAQVTNVEIPDTQLSFSRAPICGMTEHIHTDDCYEWECATYGAHDHSAWGCVRGNLICNIPEHIHDASCYPAETVYYCGKTEHTHTEACYDAYGELFCGLEEHTHSAECLVEQLAVYYCGKIEHTHTGDCYDETGTLICELEEHTHSPECLIEPAADTVYYCGKTEHTHTGDCYDETGALICLLEEHTHSPECLIEPADETIYYCGKFAHTHAADCYDINGVLTCGLEEHIHTKACLIEPADETVYCCGKFAHTHAADCYDINGVLICGLEEHIHTEECLTEPERENFCGKTAHVHGEGCYLWNCDIQNVDPTHIHSVETCAYTLICGLSEHTHTELCYQEGERVLICGKEEHIHDENCGYWSCMELGPHEHSELAGCTWVPCGLEEHVHTDECYKIVPPKEYNCGIEEHTHTAECYDPLTGALICGKSEHTHSDACLPAGDTNANGYELNTVYVLMSDNSLLTADEATKKLTGFLDNKDVGDRWGGGVNHLYPLVSGEKLTLKVFVDNIDGSANVSIYSAHNEDVTVYQDDNKNWKNDITVATRIGDLVYDYEEKSITAIIEAKEVGYGRVAFDLPNNQHPDISIGVTDPEEKFHIDVTFGNSEYGFVDKDIATAMNATDTRNITVEKLMNHIGGKDAAMYMADFASANPNSDTNAFIAYLGETIKLKIKKPANCSSEGIQVEGSDGVEKLTSADAETVGDFLIAEFFPYKTGTYKFCVKDSSGKEIDTVYVKVENQITVKTALGEKNINYINEYVYTANDGWIDNYANVGLHNRVSDNDQIKKIIFGSDGLPVFIKNYGGGSPYGFYRLFEGQEITLAYYAEENEGVRFENKNSNTEGWQFVDEAGIATLDCINIESPETITHNGHTVKKYIYTFKAQNITASDPEKDYNLRDTLRIGNVKFVFNVYDCDSDSGQYTANHFDIEIADGGTYTVTTTSVDENGSKTTEKRVYKAYVSGINGCSIYSDKDCKNLIKFLDPGQYYERGSPDNSAQYELTSAYKTDGNGIPVDDGNNPNYTNPGVVGDGERGDIVLSQIGAVVFDLQLLLVPVSVNGVPVDPNTAQNESKLSVDFKMTEQELIDAYNKCPQHNGLDFTIQKFIYATETAFHINKEFSGGALKPFDEKQFEFELYNRVPKTGVSPVAIGYNDELGNIVFQVKTVTDDGNGKPIVTWETFDRFSYSEAGEYVYYIKEVIPTDQGGITYDNRIIKMTVKVQGVGDNLLASPPEYEYISFDDDWNEMSTEKTNTPVFINHAPFELPATGGEGVPRAAPWVGFSLASSGFILLWRRRRRAKPAVCAAARSSSGLKQ